MDRALVRRDWLRVAFAAVETGYQPPALDSDGFHCPHCGVLAHQSWGDLAWNTAGNFSWVFPSMRTSKCARCGHQALWLDSSMIFPAVLTAPPAHEDLDGDARTTYDEARAVLGASPRAAAALLRLCLEQLVHQLGATSTNLNQAIGELVDMGMPRRLQQAMDALRVVGNNAVHPGAIEAHEDPAIALSLFHLVNTLVEQMITAPKQIDDVWALIPEGQRRQIERRDGA